MKKGLILFVFFLLSAGTALSAQCYGTVEYDTSATANGSSTFNITTANANELILIAYNGWPSPGAGPVTVDGNPASHINTAHTSNSAVAEVYCYSAPAAGTHTIVCTETNYNSPYYLNMASAFYVTGTCTLLSCDSLVSNEFATSGFGNINTTITTTVPNEMIFGSFVNNTAQFVPYAMKVTGGATITETMHEGNGIDASEGYESAASAGTYTLTTNDPNSCCGGGTVLVAIIPGKCSVGGMVVSPPSQSNPTCGNCDGHIAISVTGGTTPYTYSWSNGVTVDSAGGLCGGTFSITIKDAGCSDTTIVDSLIANNLIITPTVIANEPCFGSCSGSAKITVTGGVSPYTYNWVPAGGTNATATGLCGGVYTITVTDNKSCTGTTTVIITQPSSVTGVITPNNVLCNGGVGSLTVAASGGNSPYNYSWTPGGQTTATATGLKAGTYTVKITDVNGCTGSSGISLTQPVVLTASINSIVYPVCNGGTGSATGSGAGGSSPYNYNWNPGGQTTAAATGLGAGSYTVTVKDNNGCTATAGVTITQPIVVSGVITVVGYPLCNGGTGSATVKAGGGNGGYKYVWTPGGQTAATATGMTAGTYTVKITDSKGCTGSASVTMTQPATLAVTTTFTHASCGLPNGTATATVTGGTPGYNYVWTPGNQVNATAVGLLAGTYTVKVTDSHNCTASATVTITQPSAVLVSIVSTSNVTCNGTPTGTATASGSGGTAPYGYQWSPAGGNGITGTGLTAGKYTVTIKDANGCTATAGTIITQPTALNVVVSGPPIPCLGKSALYSGNASGGTGPYTYKWSPATGVGSTSSAATTLTPPGTITYTLEVTDANGCITYGYASFTFPPPLAVSINGASVTCSKRNAQLCGLATGGTGGDSYLWEPINLSSPCITIPASITTIYTLTVTDNCGVSVSATATVDVQPPPAVSFVSSATEGCAPLCVQFRNTTPPTGGKELYEWNFGNGDSLQDENPIYCYSKSGVYNVSLTVVSDSGCSSTLNQIGLIHVYGKPQTSFTYSPQPVSILTPTVDFKDNTKDNYGIAYRWWYFGDGSDSVSHSVNAVHTYHDTGRYCIELIDMNEKGCADTVTNCLVIEPEYSLYIPSAFSPNGDGINDVFKPVGEYLTDFDMYIFDRWGEEIYHTTDITKGWDGTVHGGTVSQEDTYIYKITVTDAQHNQHSYIGNVTLIK